MQYYLDKRDMTIVSLHEFNNQCYECNTNSLESCVPAPCHGCEDRCPYFAEVDTRDHDLKVKMEFGKWLDSIPFMKQFSSAEKLAKEHGKGSRRTWLITD